MKFVRFNDKQKQIESLISQNLQTSEKIDINQTDIWKHIKKKLKTKLWTCWKILRCLWIIYVWTVIQKVSRSYLADEEIGGVFHREGMICTKALG